MNGRHYDSLVMDDVVTNATIGQYADSFSMSDMNYHCYCCGQPASVWVVRSPGGYNAICDGCHFRHTVMKAAGREEEFWAAVPKPESFYGRGIVDTLAKEMSYRLGQSVDAMITATADIGCTENE